MNLSLSTDLNSRSKSAVTSEPKPSAQSYVHKRGNKPATNPRLTRSQRAKARLKTKRRLVELATALNERELASKVQQCSSTIGFLTCGQHEHKKVTNYHCQFRLCSYCAERRSRDAFRKYYPIVLAFVTLYRCQPVHLVLTQPQIEGETAKQSRARILKAFGNLTRRQFFKEYFRGGIWSVEPKLAKDRDGVYHTHLHILAFRKKQFPIKRGNNPLGDDWRDVSGGENFRLDPITDLRRGLTEVLKYISKPLDIDRFTKENLRDFLNMKNLKFYDTFGAEFRKFASKFEPEEKAGSTDDELKPDYGALEEGSACPDCSQPLFELHMSEEQHIAFLESIEASQNAPPGRKRN